MVSTRTEIKALASDTRGFDLFAGSGALGFEAASRGAASVVLSAPCTQILNPQRAADASALAAQTIMWNGRMDSDTVATTDVALSPVRIHL